MLSERSEGVPQAQPEWNWNPIAAEMDQLKKLIGIIKTLKEMGGIGALVMLSFIQRWIQPL
jgi:hypothetical protein